MVYIQLKVNSSREEVAEFLEGLKRLLTSKAFSIETDFILIRKRKTDDERHSTPYTLLDLDYSVEDVVDRLKELTLADYSETRVDKNNLDPPLLFVFGKTIEKKTVYIKLKVRETQKKKVICVSFHYAKEKMNYPFV